MKKILILIESILMIVVLAAISILIAGIALPEWSAAVLTVVPLFALLLFVAILALYRDPSTYNQRGLARARKGDQTGAIANLTRAIELNPNFAEAYLNRGFVRREGDLAGAIADYTRAIELDPNDATAYCNQGAARANMGDHAGAIADYARAIELDPKFALAYHNRGVARANMGDRAGGDADLCRARELGYKP